MQKININQLRSFIAVVKAGGFREAAQQLGVTQPAVSLALNALEKSLGKRLIEDKKTLALSEFGQFFLPRARAFVEHHDELYKTMFNETLADDSYTTIVTIPSVAQNLLPAMIKSYISIFPNTRLSIRDTSMKQINALFSQKRADIAICTTHDIDQHHAIYPLQKDQFGVVAQADHPIFNAPVTWGSFVDYRLIANNTWDPDYFEEFQGLNAKTQFSVENMGSLLSLLESTSCVTVLPKLAFPKHNHQLRFEPLTEPRQSREIGIVVRQGAKLSENEHNFFQFVQANFKQC